MSEIMHGNTHRGQTLAEYSLIFVGIVVVLIISLQVLGVSVFNLFNQQISPALAMVINGSSIQVQEDNSGNQPQPDTVVATPPSGITIPLPPQNIPRPAGPVTINPVTGEIMPVTGGGSSDSTATSSPGSEQTLQLANTIELMIASGKYDEETKIKLQELANNLFLTAAPQGFVDKVTEYGIPTTTTSKKVTKQVSSGFFGLGSKTVSSTVSTTKAIYNNGNVRQDLRNYMDARKDIVTQLGRTTLAPYDYQIVKALVAKADAVSNVYWNDTRLLGVRPASNKSIEDTLGGFETIKKKGSNVLTTRNATEPVLVTLDTADTFDTTWWNSRNGNAPSNGSSPSSGGHAYAEMQTAAPDSMY